VRVRPRPNLEVNRYFICDHGRNHYRWMNRGDRLEAPLVRTASGELRAVDWDEALDRVRTILRGASGKAVALVSPGASTEALFLARRLLSQFDWTGAFQAVMGEEAPLLGVPNLALRAERAPNTAGAELLGYSRDYRAAVEAAGQAAVVLVLDDPDVEVKTDGALIYLGTVAPTLGRPDIILPIANVAEEEGSFVNRDLRVQRYAQAKPAAGMARPAWWVLGELGEAAGTGDPPSSAAEAFDQLAAAVEAFSGLSHQALGAAGRLANRIPVTAPPQ
jgi:NADH-quinone oxidoreductase subunit G